MRFHPGQHVEVCKIWAGHATEPPLRHWFSGYVVVSDPSPYRADCVLVDRTDVYGRRRHEEVNINRHEVRVPPDDPRAPRLLLLQRRPQA